MEGAGRQRTAQPIEDGEAAPFLEAALAGASGIVLAVSGGPDSMALLVLAAGWKERPKLAVASVDHGLRPGSDEEAGLVARTAAALGIPHRTLPWTGPKPRSGIQAAARDARYALLGEEAGRLGFSHVATAHHADDQAETVLLRLAGGSGVAGLAGMRNRSQRDGFVLARPLLAFPKARLIATCEARGIPFVRDPSNDDPRFGRTRIRAALDGLAEIGLSADRLGTLAVRAARADDALAAATVRALAEAGVRQTDCVLQANWRTLQAQPEEIRLRALIELVRMGGEQARPQKLERMETLAAAIDAAASEGLRTRRSIGDRIVTLQSNGRLTIAPAPPRRRGIMPARHGS